MEKFITVDDEGSAKLFTLTDAQALVADLNSKCHNNHYGVYDMACDDAFITIMDSDYNFLGFLADKK